MRFHLLRCLAKAIAKNGAKFLCGLVPGGEVLFGIAYETWKDYRQGRPQDGLRTELGELALAPAAVVQKEAQEAAASAHLPADAQRQLATYLGQVPGMIRRSLRRPSDPTGTTVPADLPLRSPEDLLPFLPPSPPRFQAGMRPLPGVDWVLEAPLGVGGFGEVWKARHAHLRSKPPVALKFCLDPSAARVLRNEAGVLDRLMQHGRQQGIVPLLDAYLTADPPCLVYEYIEGGDLTGLIREMHARVRPTPDSANRLLLRLAEIIAAPHRADPAIVHDDLKPSNILIQRAANKFKLYVTDYGIGGLAVARAVRQTQRPTNSREQLLTEAVRGAYTPLYASPEQMARRRDEPADPRDDVHALGVIWYQLVTGDLAMLCLPSDWREEVQRRGLSESLTGLLASCLASKAEKRPDNAGVLAERLRANLNPKRRITWHRPALWVAAILLILAVAGFEGLLWVNRSISAPAAGAPVVAEPQKGQDYTNTIGMKFKWIEPGSFLMGSPDGTTPTGAPAEGERGANEKPHPVTLTKGFHMGACLVTQEQWERVMGKDENHSEFMGKTDDEKKKLPVDGVTWDDCQEFCRRLSALEGRKYTLPTEAQWEYACRAGTKTPFWWGDTISPEQANYNGTFTRPMGGKTGEYRQKTTPVDFFKPNPWGLYDMHGNLWQWCADYYDPNYYNNSINKDPKNLLKADARVLRGGSWFIVAGACRAACRTGGAPAGRSSGVGCRVCLCLD